jgi:hypothetical protein
MRQEKYEGKEREKFLEIMYLVSIKRWVRARCRKVGKVARHGSIAALFAVGGTGCVAASPSGFRFTASLGAEQVQEHTESYKVVDRTPCGGLKAWITGCATPEETPRGS